VDAAKPVILEQITNCNSVAYRHFGWVVLPASGPSDENMAPIEPYIAVGVVGG